MSKSYIKVNPTAGQAFMQKQIEGSVTMLNLLRFNDEADYSESPELAPDSPISGKDAYDLYIKAVSPLLQEAGSELVFSGRGGQNLIGPEDERWDLVLLVKHSSVTKFMAFANSPAYQAIAGHRTAALADSRLLPIIEG